MASPADGWVFCIPLGMLGFFPIAPNELVPMSSPFPILFGLAFAAGAFGFLLLIQCRDRPEL